uniref:Reverse transcriptase domain-containing protein n=1 Tax=Rhizophagus irregularis (strain DAOM 181602 / DAOM 197198 / MUCL 43194) TaxID=747089 RepID=U9SVV0_RHIID
MLDAIIHQHKHDSTDDQELWIVSQDISKAFDSMDLNMLKLARTFVHVGIDQGVIISPLL